MVYRYHDPHHPDNHSHGHRHQTQYQCLPPRHDHSIVIQNGIQIQNISNPIAWSWNAIRCVVTRNVIRTRCIGGNCLWEHLPGVHRYCRDYKFEDSCSRRPSNNEEHIQQWARSDRRGYIQNTRNMGYPLDYNHRHLQRDCFDRQRTKPEPAGLIRTKRGLAWWQTVR